VKNRVVLVLLPLVVVVAGCSTGGFGPPSGHIVYPKVLRLGQTASDHSVTEGIRSLTVFAFVYPAPMADGTTPDGYAAANVQVCAGPGGLPKPRGPLVGPDALAPGWEVNFDSGTQGGGHVVGASSLTSVLQPSLDGRTALKPNQCARGWLTFEVDGLRPYFVTFSYPYTYWRV
jgi:hypothetical protein